MRLAHLPTPLEPMDRLAAKLGGPRLLVKRDDQTGLALGGNKARKLELLCAEAMAAGCDVLVTGGGPQSNHARMTAAAANRLGLDCHLAMGGDDPGTGAGGNLLLDHLLGARLSFTGAKSYYDIEGSIMELAAALEQAGRRPYAIPVGGASVVGAVAYAEAADELFDQVGAERVDWIVVADGSGGTHAGLLAGGRGRARVLGVDVGTRPDLDEKVPELARAAAAASGRPRPDGPAVIDHDHFGPGYGRTTDATLEALQTVARLEGLILDPVYTGKAMAGLMSWAREGRLGPEETVVFWHTGGAPALFAGAYASWLTS